jgi:hypothetical protein
MVRERVLQAVSDLGNGIVLRSQQVLVLLWKNGLYAVRLPLS